MRKSILLLFSAFAAMAAHAQWFEPIPYTGDPYHIYRLYLKDKQGSAHTLDKPETFLSAKALQRRAKQHLAVDSTDLPLSQRYLDELRCAGLQVIGGSKWNNTVLVKSAEPTLVHHLVPLRFVMNCVRVFSTPEFITPTTTYPLSTDPEEALPDHPTPYGLGQHQIEMMNGIKLHEAGFRGEGMLVAIIDGGFMNVNRIDYMKNINVVGQRDFVYPYTANVYDLLDHGTMVLSDMGANVRDRFVGTAPGASFLLLRSEDGSSESLVEEDYWAQAMEYADSVGADVVNSSLGYTAFDDTTTNHRYHEQDGRTALISRTASMVARKGMILVCSAGNEGGKSWKLINFPADATDILSVAALKSDSVNTYFSSVGPSYDGRVKPDIAAMGSMSTVIDGSGYLTVADGTSFASPTACGMVACLWQALPGKTAVEIMDLVRRSGNRASRPDNVYGYGLPDFWKAYQMGKE